MARDEDILRKVTEDLPDLSRAFSKIARYLQESPREFIRQPIRELSVAIGVSEPTLIRFSRRYGFRGVPDFRLAVGVSLASDAGQKSAEFEPGIDDKEVLNRAQKKAIALEAMSQIPTGQSILLDSGSTVQCFAERLRNVDPLTIMTTSLNITLGLIDCAQHNLILTGGTVRQNARSLTGRLVESTLAGMSFDTLFLGADRIDPQFGLSTFSEEEAHLNRAMLQASRKVVVLADSTKFGETKLLKICDLSRVDVIISDSNLSPEFQAAIAKQGVELLLADASDQGDQ